MDEKLTELWAKASNAPKSRALLAQEIMTWCPPSRKDLRR